MQSAIHTGGGVSTGVGDFDYALPLELIAQVPAPRRDGARLLVLERSTGAVRHGSIRDLPAYLRPGDVIVFNDTRVRAARVQARTTTGGAAELLFVREVVSGQWLCLGRPAKRLRVGTELRLPGGDVARISERLGGGEYHVALPPSVDVPVMLAREGQIPLPPYIRRPSGTLPVDRERYQTVYAAHEGAVAAPTAGLHFTAELLDTLRTQGVILTWLTLHVGPGTFLPVRVDDIRAHHMEPEWACISTECAAVINRARDEGRRVLAVGTTTVRALESAAATGRLVAGSFWASVFVVPGFRFQVTDALLTNFHLPRSTLLMLVSALAGRRQLLDAYAVAVRERYRFYSYGDAMLILQ